jgi:predicted dehydrogenase
MRLAFLGGFGHHYLRGALSDPAIKIERPVAYAASSPDDANAERLAHDAGDVRFYKDPAELLRDYKPDVVNIGAVYGRNGDFAADFLEAGVTVVSDKPVAGTWQQLERLRKIVAAKPNAVLLTEFDFRSRATFRAARDVIKSGKIGTPVLATGQKSYRWGKRPDWYRDRASYTGTMLWIASHAIDAIYFATGRKVVAATGRQGNLSHPDYRTAEDHCVALLEYEGGMTGVAHADLLRPDKTPTHGDDRLRVAGSEGVVEVRAGRCVLLAKDGQEHDITDTVKPQPIHAEMLAAVRGQHPDLYSTAESLEMAETLLLARDAADQQAWIKRGGQK